MAPINLRIDSKNALAARISSSHLPKERARSLIDYVVLHHPDLWRDSLTASQPEKQKWVRTAHGTELGRLLKLIDRRILATLDDEMPSFIFGGRSGHSNVIAAKQLLGYEKERSLLALDISRFFENVTAGKVNKFFQNAGCNTRIAKTLTKLCCVHTGPKSKPENTNSLARGFSTSPRLAVWANMDAFHRINDLVLRELKPYDPRIAIFVDDIGITASRVPEQVLSDLEPKVDEILRKESGNRIKLNDKTKVMRYDKSIKHLGIVLTRNKLVLPSDVQAKKDWYGYQYKMTGSSLAKKRWEGYRSYENTMRKYN